MSNPSDERHAAMKLTGLNENFFTAHPGIDIDRIFANSNLFVSGGKTVRQTIAAILLFMPGLSIDEVTQIVRGPFCRRNTRLPVLFDETKDAKRRATHMVRAWLRHEHTSYEERLRSGERISEDIHSGTNKALSLLLTGKTMREVLSSGVLEESMAKSA